MVEGCDQIKAIGGYFELADKDCEFAGMPVDGVALNTCRNALEYIILQLLDAKRIFVPYYTCEAVIEPLKRLQIEYQFYHINEQLEIAEELKLEEGDYLIANNYFGIKDAYIEWLAGKYGDRLIVDNAQALFAPVLPNIKAAYSTRKYVGVADGGFAVGVPAVGIIDYEEDNSSEHDSHLYIRKERGAEAGFKDYQANECKLDDQLIRKMSPQTKTILSQIDYNSVIKKRRQNYEYLNNALGEKNFLQLPLMDSFTCPMIYPFITDDESLRDRLIQNKVFVARYWPNVLEWCDEDELEYKLAAQIIPLPVDQRYGEVDMMKIIELISK
ncbi:MAG: hypothetical protein IKA45_06430 [Bacteroidales bacterium]|nr:hypothetical protein [Bacteroidales bacterium]